MLIVLGIVVLLAFVPDISLILPRLYYGN